MPRSKLTRPASDDGVSAVIGVILMVAITVAIAATVYIWVGGFGAGEGGGDTATVQPHSANASNDWIRVTLNDGDRAPYDAQDVSVEVLDSNNSVHNTLCHTPEQAGEYPGCEEPFESGDTWNVGSSRYIPCEGEGSHQVTLTVMGTTVLDRSVNCENAA